MTRLGDLLSYSTTERVAAPCDETYNEIFSFECKNEIQQAILRTLTDDFYSLTEILWQSLDGSFG